MATGDPKQWFLQFSPAGDGRPWGDWTAMAKRQAAKADPWDAGCLVTPLVGGFWAMSAMRNALEKAINNAKRSSLPAGQKGHVYITGWRLNALRDLSETNPWKTSDWGPASYPSVTDQTAIGLILRMMQEGIKVRVLIWLPPAGWVADKIAGMAAHREDHIYIAHTIQKENENLVATKPEFAAADPIGVCALAAIASTICSSVIALTPPACSAFISLGTKSAQIFM